MGYFKDIKYCFSFLTRFPVKREIKNYEEIATKIWLFPIVGFMLGLISSLISLILLKVLPFLMIGFISLGLLMFMTGVHHTDGLIDFGDGLMASGSPERKIEVMHDVTIGAGGFTLGLIVITLTGIALSYSMNFIIIALIISEIGAKFGMVAACSIGKSAKTKMADPFIGLNTKKHMLISLILSIILIFFTILFIMLYIFIYECVPSVRLIFNQISKISLFNYIQIVSLYAIFLLGTFLPLLIILRIANKNFNGLTGDCLGALNEIIRLFTLILLLVFNSLKII